MPVTMIVTRALPDRWRGFLQSVSLEIGIGVFLSPDMRSSVRKRVWEVATDWFQYQDGGSFVMAWVETGRVHHLSLGEAPRQILFYDGIPIATLSCYDQKKDNLHRGSLTIESI